MESFPFFVGCDRSGTTLVQAVFDAHSQLAIPYESHFVAQLLRRRQRYETEHGFDLDGFQADLFFYPFAQRWELARADISAALNDRPPRSVPDAIRAVFALYARAQGKPHYGDKTPGYVRRIPLLAAALPESFFVHIVRDGRNVALSLLEVEWGPGSVVDAARFWKQRVEAGRAAGRALGASRYVEIRYEDFIADLAGSARRICEVLGLPFEESMLDYTTRAAQILGQTDVPHRHQGLLDAPKKDKRDWRSEMTSHQVALFEAVAGSSLENFGYQPANETIPPQVRAEAQVRLAVRKLRGIPDRIRAEGRARRKRLGPAP